MGKIWGGRSIGILQYSSNRTMKISKYSRRRYELAQPSARKRSNLALGALGMLTYETDCHVVTIENVAVHLNFFFSIIQPTRGSQHGFCDASASTPLVPVILPHPWVAHLIWLLLFLLDRGRRCHFLPESLTYFSKTARRARTVRPRSSISVCTAYILVQILNKSKIKSVERRKSNQLENIIDGLNKATITLSQFPGQVRSFASYAKFWNYKILCERYLCNSLLSLFQVLSFTL